jgi:hypothetical protein
MRQPCLIPAVVAWLGRPVLNAAVVEDPTVIESLTESQRDGHPGPIAVLDSPHGMSPRAGTPHRPVLDGAHTRRFPIGS